MGTPHKHAALIKAWADGAEIQYRLDKSKDWEDIKYPMWKETVLYRIKPKTIKYRNALMLGANYWVNSAMTQEQACIIADQPGFIKWISDWQQVEVS